MAKSTGYKVDWLAEQLHKFPHYNFNFDQISSTFAPELQSYKEAIVLLAALPILWCIFVLLIASLCLCVQCCKSKPKSRSTTCLRFVIALFIIFCIGSIAVGFFGNEEGNKGIQSTSEALQDTNDTLTGSLVTLDCLDTLTSDITKGGIDALKEVFNKYLKNETLRKEVLKLAEEVRNQSIQVHGDIDEIRTEVGKVNLDKLMDMVSQAELYRWIGTIALFSWQVIGLLVHIIGTLKKSKCWLVWAVVLGFVSLFLVWVFAGGYLGGSVGLSDFCVDPNTYVVSKLQAGASSDIVQSYIECKDNRDPQKFSKALNDALNYVSMANNTLTIAINKTKSYNISQYLEGPVKVLRLDLTYTQGNITSLSDTVFCGHIHNNYIKALTGLCKRTLVGLGLILLVLPILGLSLMMVQCLVPRVWLRLTPRKKSSSAIDDTDPFLPRPPPYNGYGTIGEETTPLRETSYLEDSTVMTEPPRSATPLNDSPPPAYRVSSFMDSTSDLGTFPIRYSGVNHYATSNI